MKPFELMAAYPAVEFIPQQNRADRRALAELLEALKKYTHNCKDLAELHSSGREHFCFFGADMQSGFGSTSGNAK